MYKSCDVTVRQLNIISRSLAMDSNAKAYSALNKPQYDIGCEFVRSLNVFEGDKVLDMGCGTGDVTNYIASLVGQYGEVVGVDPDEERIKIAQEKFKDVQNLKFVVGDSSSGFPHDNEEYYDLHFSNAVFHWLIGDDIRQGYLRKAYQCLKPGGCLAIRTVTPTSDTIIPGGVPIACPTEDGIKKLFKDVCLFTNLATEIVGSVVRFSSINKFEAWRKATFRVDSEEPDPECSKNLMQNSRIKAEADGTLSFCHKGILRITAEKKGLL